VGEDVIKIHDIERHFCYHIMMSIGEVRVLWVIVIMLQKLGCSVFF